MRQPNKKGMLEGKQSKINHCAGLKLFGHWQPQKLEFGKLPPRDTIEKHLIDRKLVLDNDCAHSYHFYCEFILRIVSTCRKGNINSAKCPALTMYCLKGINVCK